MFGERVRRARDAAGLTQERAADRVGISLRYDQMIGRGEKSVSLDTLVKLGGTLGVSLDYLLLGNAPAECANPITELFRQLTSRQREDALEILRLYGTACTERTER